MFDYSYLLRTKCAEKWKRIGLKRRAGVVVPLFSVYSKHSAGIGELSDIRLIVEWCKQTGLSIIQLLPLNDTECFSPYSSVSSFALDPMYITLYELRDVNIEPFKQKINQLRNKYKLKSKRINYAIKKEKFKLLKKIFAASDWRHNENLQEYIHNNSCWLNDYCLYKIFSDKMGYDWTLWDKNYSASLFREIIKNYEEEIYFISWVQWQLYEQLTKIKKYANSNNILLMGDLPILVSKNSSDVWSHPEYFKLNLSAGAPPDMYHAHGQNWGSPPFDWVNIAKNDFQYIRNRLKYAENFYDMFRIDHFIGLFRIWTLKNSDVNSSDSVSGSFDPEHEWLWEEHGKRIIDVIIDSTEMMPCAEDLGTVPDCSYKTLHEYGITGIDFQRYEKNNYTFTPVSNYRKNSAAVISTHDSSLFCNWWKYEAGTIDEMSFIILCSQNNISGKKLKEYKNTLFDIKHSSNGRLRWNKNIDSETKLKFILGLTEKEAHAFIKMYHDTFNEKNKFTEFLNGSKIAPKKCTSDFYYEVLKKISSSSSIFSIQLLHEYSCLDKIILKKLNTWSYRINTPASVGKNNWSVLLPVSLDYLLKSYAGKNIISKLREINNLTDRTA